MAMDKWVREILDTLKRLEAKIDAMSGGGAEAELETETGKGMEPDVPAVPKRGKPAASSEHGPNV